MAIQDLDLPRILVCVSVLAHSGRAQQTFSPQEGLWPWSTLSEFQCEHSFRVSLADLLPCHRDSPLEERMKAMKFGEVLQCRLVLSSPSALPGFAVCNEPWSAAFSQTDRPPAVTRKHSLALQGLGTVCSVKKKDRTK